MRYREPSHTSVPAIKNMVQADWYNMITPSKAKMINEGIFYNKNKMIQRGPINKRKNYIIEQFTPAFVDQWSYQRLQKSHIA